MIDNRLDEIVQRQRRQLAMIGWGAVVLGGFLVLLSLGSAIGDRFDDATTRGLAIGGAIVVAGIATIIRSRR